MKPQFKTPVSVGLAVGIYFGIGLFLIGVTAWLRGYGKIFVSFMSTFYLGYTYTFGGALMGILRGLIDGFVAGFIITFLTQYFQKKIR